MARSEGNFWKNWVTKRIERRRDVEGNKDTWHHKPNSIIGKVATRTNSGVIKVKCTRIALFFKIDTYLRPNPKMSELGSSGESPFRPCNVSFIPSTLLRKRSGWNSSGSGKYLSSRHICLRTRIQSRDSSIARMCTHQMFAITVVPFGIHMAL